MAKSNIILVGDVEIMALSDGMLEFDLCNFFPTHPRGRVAAARREAHRRAHKVRFNLGSYLIRSTGRTILVDTGLGPRPADTPTCRGASCCATSTPTACDPTRSTWWS